MQKINWLRLILSLIICQSAGLVGSVFTSSSVNTWYKSLNKPEITPPGSFIGIVWTILFILMGISFYLVWQKGFGKNKLVLIFFIVQFVLNIGWSFFFFYLQNPLAGLIEIAVLWISILITIIYFYTVSKPAAYLLIPYIFWVSFASYLNYLLFKLN